MKFKKYILKSISMLLAFIMVFQQIPFGEIKAEAAFSIPEYRVLFYTDPFKSGYFNNITDISTVTDLPEYSIEMASDASFSYAQANKWKTLTDTDQLSPGEIHRRVQDDLWFRYKDAGILEGGELPIKYDKNATAPDISIDGKDLSVSMPSKSSGRADIYKENKNETGLWEVKPPSYWTKNKINGILQLAGYVYFGVDEAEQHIYEFGEIAAPNTITGGSSSFNAYYVCTDLVTTWPETVTYNFNYTITEDSLIIYDFKRSEPVQGEHALSPAAASAFGLAAKKLLDSLKNKLPGGSSAPQPGYSYNYNPEEDPIDDSIDDSENKEVYSDHNEQEQLQRLLDVLKVPAVIGIGAITWWALEHFTSLQPSKLIIAIESGLLTIGDAMNIALPAFAAYDYDDELIDYVYGEDGMPEADNEDENLTNDIQNEADNYKNASNAAPPRDPLAIDFGDTGINLTTLNNGVNFDLDNNGFAEKTAWIGEEDGFLVLDVNKNGKIDNGSELFGDQFIRLNGQCSEFGFEALSDFDEDDDRQITEEDSVFEELLVWIDQNHNGESESNELFTLAEKNITAISIDYTKSNYRDTETGTYIAETATVTLSDGTTTISEFWFDVDTTKTMQNGTITSGNVLSIMDAIHSDETGETAQIYLNFLFADDIAVRRYYLKHFLYKITDSEDIEPTSRGGNIDARDLHMVEQFMGRTFDGVDGANPNAPAAAILNQICTRIENIYYCILISQTEFNIRRQKMVTDPETNELDITALTNDITGMIACEDSSVSQLIYDLGVYLHVYDNRSNTCLFNLYQEFCNTLPQQYAELAEIAGAEAYTFIGTDDTDRFNGLSSINYLFGQDSSDVLTGSNGNDILYGGSGDDTLSGSKGNDIYVIESGHGNDVIRDVDGVNLIIFADYFTEADYSIAVDANNGFVMTNKSTSEIISIPDFLKNPLNYKFSFGGVDATFSGGGTQNILDGTNEDDYLESGDGFNVFYGGDGNDTLAGGANMDFMYGENGDDLLLGRNGVNVLFGGTGNDTIYDGDDGSYLSGGDGDDSLYGGGGADVLDGGAGNDYLQADHGNDTYVFGKGYDTDTINASSDLNTVIVHGYRSIDMINTRNAHNDLIINFKNSDDCLIIDHFFDYNSNRDFNFVFDDGTVLGQHDITAKYAPIDGTDADEWLAIQNSDDGIIHGNGGNDGVSGGSGNDELYGDSGDDTLYGNDGNDILDGGTGTDVLNGGNGADTYIFAKGYGNDTVNEWGSDHSIIKLTDIKSNEVTVNDLYGSNLLLSIVNTEDTLVISNFKWGQATYTFEFADGAVATVNKDTWAFEFSQLPIVPEEEEVTTSDTTTVTDETTVETEVPLETTEDEEIQSTEESDTSIETENTASEVIIETKETTINDVGESDSADTKEVTEQNDSQEADATENVIEETGSDVINIAEVSVDTDVT